VRTDPFLPVLALAERQHALFRRDQALLVVSPDQLDDALASGRFERPWPSVYRVHGAPATPESRTLAAVWAAGPDAAASHRSSGWLWGGLPEPPDRPELLLPDGSRCLLPGITVHRTRDFRPEVVRIRRGIPTVDPLLTMLHLGAVLSRRELSDVLEAGLASRLFSMPAMWATLDRYGKRGRNGAGVLRAVVEDRALGEKPSDSVLEERGAQVLSRCGITDWVFHHQIWVNGTFIAEPDFSILWARLAIEFDGAGKLNEPGALDAFLDRQNRVTLAGWTLLRFTWAMVVRRPAYVVRVIQEHLRNLTRLEAG
jgi:very-short-patch-repair endonuclease